MQHEKRAFRPVFFILLPERSQPPLLNVEGAVGAGLQVRLFGKPEIDGTRRLGVALATGAAEGSPPTPPGRTGGCRQPAGRGRRARAGRTPSVTFDNVEGAVGAGLQVRLFGKPEIDGTRRLGVASGQLRKDHRRRRRAVLADAANRQAEEGAHVQGELRLITSKARWAQACRSVCSASRRSTVRVVWAWR
jgi:hypothetical protein